MDAGPVASLRGRPQAPPAPKCAPQPKDGALVLLGILAGASCTWRAGPGVEAVQSRLLAACAAHGLQPAVGAGPPRLVGVVVVHAWRFLYASPNCRSAGRVARCSRIAARSAFLVKDLAAGIGDVRCWTAAALPYGPAPAGATGVVVGLFCCFTCTVGCCRRLRRSAAS